MCSQVFYINCKDLISSGNQNLSGLTYDFMFLNVTECNCTTLIWWDLAICKQADKTHSKFYLIDQSLETSPIRRRDKVKIRSRSYISTPKLNPKISKNGIKLLFERTQKFKHTANVVGVKPRDQNEESWNLKKQRKNSSTTHLRKSHHNWRFPAKKKPKKKWMMEKQKPIKAIRKKSSDFKLLKMDNEHVCVCVCVCALKTE
jgi:hypothetical protein